MIKKRKGFVPYQTKAEKLAGTDSKEVHKKRWPSTLLPSEEQSGSHIFVPHILANKKYFSIFSGNI